jgi:hypothetical protein
MMKRPVLSAVAEIARRAERTGCVGEWHLGSGRSV